MPAGFPVDPGLCARCKHTRRLENASGSVFHLCRRADTDPGQYTRYPRLPVVSCSGFEPGAPDAKGDAHQP